MNYDALADHLNACGYNVSERTFQDKPAIVVRQPVGAYQVELIHFEVDTFDQLPVFRLKDAHNYGQLAHLLCMGENLPGFLCVNETDAVSVNYEQPHLALETSLRRHLDLLTQALLDPAWNKSELLREFQANWSNLCRKSQSELVVAAQAGSNETIQIYKPVPGKSYGLDAKYLGITDSANDLSQYSYITLSDQRSERKASNAKGYILSVPELPVPPAFRHTVGEWYIDLLHHLPDAVKAEFVNRSGGYRAAEFWVIINGATPSGVAWVSLHFTCGQKRTLPQTSDQLADWLIEPLQVVLFNSSLVMSRSGADTRLTEKKVLLVGCGSVGSEIATKLASAGVGKLALLDDDTFSLDNLYRHTLCRTWIDSKKVQGLKFEIGYKYPWITVNDFDGRLLDSGVKSKQFLEVFDLIVIAIGAPTQERLFHDFLLEHRVSTPIINTWLEGYGVGGHATLDIPSSKGCLRCAYVDHDTLGRGLSSNLNFLEDNQSLTVNHAGCGQLYLPYSGINATQTALIASDLAVKYLRGRLNTSSKMSWKGDDTDAIERGFRFTHRYRHFDRSLKIMPLYNEYCDLCHE